MMTKLWIDGQCLQTESRLRGIGRYVEELLRALSKRADVELSISFNAAMADEALAARDRIASWIPRDRIHVWEAPRAGGEAIFGLSDGRRLGAIALAHHVACIAPDVALSASPFEGFAGDAIPLEPNDLAGCPVASIFYDAIPMRFPERYLTSAMLRTAYDRRLSFLPLYDLNLCISAFSVQEATEIARGAGRNINISAGISRELSALRDTVIAFESSAPYVLYVGALDWRKNVDAIVEAFALLKPSLRDNTSFVYVGPRNVDLIANLRARWRELGLPAEHLVVRTEVSDIELVTLYQGAKLLVNASYMEGFGLPALEAMSFGVPVLVARRGAAIEVVQDQHLMFEPDDYAGLSALITRMLEDPAFAGKKAREGLERARQFTWERTAEIAATALAEIARSGASDGKRSSSPSLPDLRQAAMQAIFRQCPNAADIAEVMARAEPEPSHETRLFVDATSLIRFDGGTGIQRVTRNISKHLAERGAIVIFGDQDTRFSPARWEAGRLVPPHAGSELLFNSSDTILMLDSSWEFQAAYEEQLRAARLRGAQVVSAIYDFVPMLMPAFCVSNLPPIYVDWFKSALRYSNGFVCISQAVALELQAILRAIRFPHSLKIGWWPLGADLNDADLPAPSQPAAGQPRHFLMVGTIEPRKGYDVALAAFELLWADGFDTELTIIGRQGWATEELVRRIQTHPEAGHRLHLRGGVSDHEMALAYAGADALISASHAEGFGLPLVEARHFGKPAIVSDLPVFREISAGAGNVLFFDPGKPASLAQAIRLFASESAKGTPPSTAWANWKESTASLIKIVQEGLWQMEYRPEAARQSDTTDDIGETWISELLNPHDERPCEIDVMVVEPLGEKGVRLRIRVVNRSQRTWSSNLECHGELGFRILARLRDAAGQAIGTRATATLPFVLAPGQQAILPVEFETVPEAACDVQIEAGQASGSAWAGAVSVPINAPGQARRRVRPK